MGRLLIYLLFSLNVFINLHPLCWAPRAVCYTSWCSCVMAHRPECRFSLDLYHYHRYLLLPWQVEQIAGDVANRHCSRPESCPTPWRIYNIRSRDSSFDFSRMVQSAPEKDCLHAESKEHKTDSSGSWKKKFMMEKLENVLVSNCMSNQSFLIRLYSQHHTFVCIRYIKSWRGIAVSYACQL